MKKCMICGYNNPDDSNHCSECQGGQTNTSWEQNDPVPGSHQSASSFATSQIEECPKCNYPFIIAYNQYGNCPYCLFNLVQKRVRTLWLKIQEGSDNWIEKVIINGNLIDVQTSSQAEKQHNTFEFASSDLENKKIIEANNLKIELFLK